MSRLGSERSRPEGWCARRHGALRSRQPGLPEIAFKMAPHPLLSMVFSPSSSLPVVVTADLPTSVDRTSWLPADRVITIPCSVPASALASDQPWHQPITWQELLGQR